MSVEEPQITSNPAKPTAADGCGVDLSWLEGREIKRITNDLQNIVIEFEDGLIFKVQSLSYKGQPFLSFNPYQDPGV